MTPMNKTSRLLALFAILVLLPGLVTAQGRLVLDRVHGDSLERTLTRESTDRVVAVYLPPSYADSPKRRYPVLYLLHGIGGTHEDWTRPTQSGHGQSVQDLMDRGIAAGRIAEMIVVAPNQRTRGGGSFYTNSEVTGAWEDFTAIDLVKHVDGTYRTLSQASSRGVAGHSMGGYGAIKMGMRHPDVFQVVYGMNSAVLGYADDLSSKNPAFARATKVTGPFNPRRDVMVASILCIAQALSPNPKRPPFFVDLPYAVTDGALSETPAFERWKKEMPLYMLDRYQANLRKLRALRFDSGRNDAYTHIPSTNRLFSERLDALKVPHVFEDYNGDHRNRLWGVEGRIATEVLPFFSRMLEARAKR